MSERGELTTIVAVAVGGAIGASARWTVGDIVATRAPDDFPWHTLSVNVVGCFLIGLVATRVRRESAAWAFVATGLLGGFTTMSSFAVELDDLADAGRNGTAIAYLVTTIVAGFAALAVAEALGGPIDESDVGTEGIE